MHKLKKIIEYGLYLLVFLLPWQTRWIIKAGELNGGYWEYGTFSLYITDVLLILILLFYIVWLFKNKKYSIFNIQYSKIWYLIAGLELFVFISIFFAPDKLLAMFGYGRFLLGVGLFWLIISAPYNKLKLIYSFIAGACLSAGLGIWQFLTQASFANKWLGLALHDPADLGTSVVEIFSGGRWLRAYGSLDHPNVLGGLLVIGLLLTIGLIIDKQSAQNEKLEIGNLSVRQAGWKYVILLSVVCCLLSALFFTFSRGAWLSLSVGLIVITAITAWQKKNDTLKRLLKTLAVSAAMLAVLIGLYSGLVKTRLFGDTRLEVKSNVERLESYTIAKEVIKKHWLFGTGINNYTLTVYKEIDPEQPEWYYQPVHNVFLLVWAEIGIFGLIFFILLLCVMCYKLCKKQEKIGFSIILILAFIAMFDHFFWSLHFGILLFWLITGIINIKFKKYTQLNN